MEEKAEKLKAEKLKATDTELLEANRAVFEHSQRLLELIVPVSDLRKLLIERLGARDVLENYIPLIRKIDQQFSDLLTEAENGKRAVAALLFVQEQGLTVGPVIQGIGWGCTRDSDGSRLSWRCAGPLEAIEAAMERLR